MNEDSNIAYDLLIGIAVITILGFLIVIAL